jgi:predicted GIY-YIG superfamily endonuclease
MYLSQDPIGLNGGSAFYVYVHDTNSWVDVFGLVKNSQKPHQDVYALYEKGSKKPYYVGISQDADMRLQQHTSKRRFNPATDEMRVLHKQLPYAQARAQEQFNIEKYNTIDRTNRKANQQNSFRKDRIDENGMEYRQEYDKLKKGGTCP